MEIKTIRVMSSLSRNYQKAEFEIQVEPSEGETPIACSTQAEKYCLGEAYKMLTAAETLTKKEATVEKTVPQAPTQTQEAPRQFEMPKYPSGGSRPMSEKQAGLLRHLGYAGDTSGWSAKQASAMIDQIMASKGGNR